MKTTLKMTAIAAFCSWSGLAVAQNDAPQGVAQPGSVAPISYQYADQYGDYYADYYADDEGAAPAANGHKNGHCNGCADACDNGCGDACGNGCGTLHGCSDRPKWINLSGWVNAGATVNNWGGRNVDVPQAFFPEIGPKPANTGVNYPVLFNDVPEGQFNQAYFIFNKPIDTSDRWLDWGYQVDFLYGSDARFTLATGLDDNIITDRSSAQYKFAIPQLYAEFGMGDLSVIVGHFYTIIGYEVVPATGNFFYSHAYTMLYGEPFTHTGVLGSYALGDAVTIYSGITNGWDNWNDHFNRANYLGGITVTPAENTSLALAMTTGDTIEFENNVTMYSFVGSQGFGPFTYVFQHDRGIARGGSATADSAQWYGINQYLFLEQNDMLAWGMRLEWFRDRDGVRVAANGVATNYYECTFGANVRPSDWAIIRPEVRWDWQGGGDPVYALGTRTTQFTAACDFIVTY